MLTQLNIRGRDIFIVLTKVNIVGHFSSVRMVGAKTTNKRTKEGENQDSDV